MPPARPEPTATAIADESLSNRLRRVGPLPAAAAWTLARQTLAALAELHAQGRAHGQLDPARIWLTADGRVRLLKTAVAFPSAQETGFAKREDLRRLGRVLWSALTGDDFDALTPQPVPWQRLAAAGVTPALGGLPMALARLLEPAATSSLVDAPTLLGWLEETLLLGSPDAFAATGVFSPQPSDGVEEEPVPLPTAPAPAPTVATPPPPVATALPKTRPAVARSKPEPARRFSRPRWVWPLRAVTVLLGVGAVLVMAGRPWLARRVVPGPRMKAAPVAPPPVAPAVPVGTLPPSLTPQTVDPAAVRTRLDRVRQVQPDTAEVLRYARELRLLATVPVGDVVGFPPEDTAVRVAESLAPDHTTAAAAGHRAALVLVLGFGDDPAPDAARASSQQFAEQFAQALALHGVTLPIYACGLGKTNGSGGAGVGPTGAERTVEVWVGFTLF